MDRNERVIPLAAWCKNNTCTDLLTSRHLAERLQMFTVATCKMLNKLIHSAAGQQKT